MDWKKFFIAFVAAFGFIFLFGFLWYGKLMHGAHQEVPILWRTEADFGNHFSTLVFGHIVMAFFLTYVFIFAWGWLLNGVFLKDVYAETPNLWRSQSEMMSLFHWIITGQALLVFAFVAIYASGFAGGGVISGIRLGILLEIAAIGMRLAIYAVQPFPAKLIIYGSISGLIEMIIVGAIVGAIYKPAVGRTA